MKKTIAFILKEAKQDKNILVFVASLFVFSLLRIPSLIEPYWYGDEGIYEVIGMALRQGRALYQGIWDNKPPLLYILYAVVNGEQFWIRFLSLLIGAASVWILFLLASKLFKNHIAVYTATFFYSIFFGLPLLEGNIANSENFMLFPTLLAFYLLLSSEKEKKPISYIYAGLLLSISFLLKIVAVFDFFALCLLIFIIKYYKDLPKRKTLLKDLPRQFQHELLLGISFALPIIITFIYFFLKGNVQDYIRATFLQNVGYVGYGNAIRIAGVTIPQGWLILKTILLVAFVVGIFIYRKYFTRAGLLIGIWFACSLFSALFSARPYTHYMLVMLPSFSLLVGYFFETKRKAIVGAFIIIITLFIMHNFGFYKKNTAYYKNYLEFVFGQKSVESYQAFFDRNTPRDYELARFISLNTSQKDQIFLWSDSGQIYALANKLPPGRYIVAYHILFYPTAKAETKLALDRARPKYIIDTKHTADITTFLPGYIQKYTVKDAVIYERKF